MAHKPFSYVQTDIPRQLTVDEYRRGRAQPAPRRRFLAVSVREVRRHGQARVFSD
jgi:hypothetical protein